MRQQLVAPESHDHQLSIPVALRGMEGGRAGSVAVEGSLGIDQSEHTLKDVTRC